MIWHTEPMNLVNNATSLHVYIMYMNETMIYTHLQLCINNIDEYTTKILHAKKLGIQHVAKKDMPPEWLQECCKEGEDPTLIKFFN